MNYKQALEYIHKINWCFCKPGLERIAKLLNKLGNPQKNLKFIHVAGTNGKGSFCAMLSSVLSSAGYRTGLFTSPYVKIFNERMAIDGEMISDNDLARLVEKIKPIADEMNDKPTEFELITAVAFEYFAESKCDYVVLECGLGGRLDSTNIIDTPVLSVITGIALDHTSILGNTIEQIATEKAGIIKKGIPCLWCGESIEAKAKIEQRAKEMSAPLHTVKHENIFIKRFDLNGTVFDFEGHKNVYIPLLGEYQPKNAANVLRAIGILRTCGIEISDEAIRNGLANVVWHARYEIISKSPLVLVDGGHNPEGVEAAVRSTVSYFNHERLIVITGVMADKDYDYISDRLCEIADSVYCITPDNPRALKAEEYARIFNEKGVFAKSFETINDALCEAMRQAINQKKAVLCVGSLYSYAEICEAVDSFMAK